MLPKRMTLEDEKLSYILHKMLDDTSIDQSIRIDIIKWFDQFEYIDLSKLTMSDLIMRQLQNMEW